MRNLMIILCFLGFISCKSGRKNVMLDKGNYSYSTVCLGLNDDGLLRVKAYATGENYKDSKENALRKVLKEIIFKGIIDGNKDCFQKPIISNTQVEVNNQAYFSKFYNVNSTRSSFVKIERELATKDQIKDLKSTQNTNVPFEISVDRNKIKKELISDGIIKI